MNTFGITGTEQILLGVYLIAHGLIHIVFLFYFNDKKTNVFTGWSGKSWLLSKFLSGSLIKPIGYIIWASISVLFVISGLAILDIPDIGNFLVTLLVFVCCLAIVAFLVFFNDLYPTPYHWILGAIIDVIILAFILFFSNNVQLLLIVLIAIWLYGMFVHTKIVSLFITKSTTNQF